MNNNGDWIYRTNDGEEVAFRVDYYPNATKLKTTYNDVGWRLWFWTWDSSSANVSWRYRTWISTTDCVDDFDVYVQMGNRNSNYDADLEVGIFADLVDATGRDTSVAVSWPSDGSLRIPGLNRLTVSPVVPSTWDNKYSGIVGNSYPWATGQATSCDAVGIGLAKEEKSAGEDGRMYQVHFSVPRFPATPTPTVTLCTDDHTVVWVNTNRCQPGASGLTVKRTAFVGISVSSGTLGGAIYFNTGYVLQVLSCSGYDCKGGTNVYGGFIGMGQMVAGSKVTDCCGSA
jgi:hypothetical protein